jgi:hypothetical protein
MRISIEPPENSSIEARGQAPHIEFMTHRIARATSRKMRPLDAEPSLSELIDDPMMRAIMARDGLDCVDLVGAIDTARARLGLGPWIDAPCGPATSGRPAAGCCA